MNALLKTLEEPPNNVTLLLTAAQAEDLLPTIVSRCEQYALRPQPLAEVQEALITRWQVEADRAALLTALSGGRLGWAVRLHTDPDALDERAQRLADLLTLLPATRVERFAYAEKLARATSLDQLQATLELWQSFWRDVLLTAAQAATPLMHRDHAADIRRLAQQLTLPMLQNTLTALNRTRALLERNVNARLALEVMLLDWPRLR